MRLAAKSALITGAAAGFGAGIARRFAQEGARVTILDLDEAGGAAGAGAIGEAATSLKGDVTVRAAATLMNRITRADEPGLPS